METVIIIIAICCMALAAMGMVEIMVVTILDSTPLRPLQQMEQLMVRHRLVEEPQST